MSQRDPIEALSNFYSSHPEQGVNEELLGQIYRKRAKRKHKLYGAACGFSLGAAAATLLLCWAARPSQAARNQALTAIERYQMINSGLAERHQDRGLAIR
jgi:hypothetical protein